MTDKKIEECKRFFAETDRKLDEIKEEEYDRLDKNSKSEHDGLKDMFEMLCAINFKELKQ